MTGIESIALEVAFWLFGDGLKFFLLVDGGILIVIFRVEDWVASLHATQVVLGHVVGRVGEPTTKVGTFRVLKILGVVHKVLRLPHIHFIQVYLLFNDIDPWRRHILVLAHVDRRVTALILDGDRCGNLHFLPADGLGLLITHPAEIAMSLVS